MAKKKRKGSGGKQRPKPKQQKPKAQGPADAPGAPPSPPAQPSMSSKERRELAQQRIKARQRRKQLRYVAIIGGVLALILVLLGGRWFIDRRAGAAYQELAETAGCTEVQRYSGERAHWDTPGDPVPTYETEPPVVGDHHIQPLNPGIYSEPLKTTITEQGSVYQAVHSLEHGYVVVWHNGLEADTQGELERALRGQRKVIMVPYPQMPEDYVLALSAWGRLQYCNEADVDVVEAFAERYRDRTGPEATQT